MPETAEVQTAPKLPRYKSHKEVHAIKIEKIESRMDGTALVHAFPDRNGRPTCAPIEVPAGWVAKHNPSPGGYLVIYEGGYQSWSPADAFESGYTRID
ncbi:MAG: hypothetical protein AB7I42_24185 [Bradyrhizobium sp.]|uniref:hypothetical protein n=1 Tax=Bradyrhizobium sp. TaxID=376 RepID=UPI003D09B9EC